MSAIPEQIERISFLVDERPRVLFGAHLSEANRRFLGGIDADYWTYHTQIDAEAVFGEDEQVAQRAAAALRVAYGPRHRDPTSNAVRLRASAVAPDWLDGEVPEQ